MLILRVGGSVDHPTDLGDPAEKFLTPKDSGSTSIFSSLGVIFSRGVKSSHRSLFLLRGTSHTDFGLSSGYFVATLLLHVVALVLVLRFVHFTVDAQNRFESTDFTDAKIYYFPPKPEKQTSIPKIAPKGPGSTPGRGQDIPEAPARKSTAFHQSLTVVSNPRQPDNLHQTIIQASSPPDLKIKEDLKLPNIVIGNPMAQPKNPMIALKWKAPAAKQSAAKNVKNEAVPQTSSQKWMDLTVVGNIVPEAGLPVAPPQPPPQPAAAPASGSSGATASDANRPQGAPGSSDMMVIGTDPVDHVTQLSLPAGNRYGSFSISPDGAGAGSVGGTGKSGAGAGTMGSGPGGNVSSGVGSGTSGGGGGTHTSDIGSVSISGSTGGGSIDPALRASIAETMVYPVESTSNLRRNSMIVSSGAVGGGGLPVYKALQCGKIYTIFLPMPGGNWTLEFCRQGSAPEPVNTEGKTAVIHMEAGVLPPEATQVFDFKRLPVPELSQHKQIILRGLVDPDGSVKDVKVYTGLEPQMDEAARLAFSKWKFKPAIQSGKPVPIEFLVGIPPVVR